MWRAISAVLLGNRVVEMATRRHAEPVDLHACARTQGSLLLKADVRMAS